MIKREDITPELVRELLYYDEIGGVMVWRARARRWFSTDHRWKWWNARYAGEVAGSVVTMDSGYRYVVVKLLGRRRSAHRLAWMWKLGEEPPEHIDHIDGDATHNRWVNIRAATPASNCRNMALYRNNTSGQVGVYWHRPISRWVAKITADGKTHYLGSFADKEDAIAVRQQAERELGFSDRHGLPALPYSDMADFLKVFDKGASS